MGEAVAIVGTGCVTALGFGVEATLAALAEGHAGTLAARVAEPYLRREVPRPLQPQIKFLNGAGLLAVEAAEEAWAPWTDDDVAGEQKGLFLAQMDAWDWSCRELRAGFAAATEDFARPLESEALNREVARRTKPFFLLESLKNNAFSFLANLHELKGANTAVGGWAGASLAALDFAARAVRRGDLDRALVVGAGRAAHGVARADAIRHGLSRGDDPAFRPFDPAGRGEVRGEGAGALALEREADALAAKRRPLGRLLGHGACVDAARDDLPVPRAAAYADAVSAALDAAGLGGEALAFAVVPGFGLPEADGEVLAVREAVPSLARVPFVCWRGALGAIPLGGELVDVALALAALAEGRVPGTVGLRADVAGVSRRTFAPEGRAALILAAGLGGDASAVVVEAPSRLQPGTAATRRGQERVRDLPPLPAFAMGRPRVDVADRDAVEHAMEREDRRDPR